MSKHNFRSIESDIKMVILAINHYISTGDRLGEGMAMSDGDKLIFAIPVNRVNCDDIADWLKLNSKLQEISRPAFDLVNYEKTHANFDNHLLKINKNDCHAFARALTESPGKMGWGSVKAVLDYAGYKSQFASK